MDEALKSLNNYRLSTISSNSNFSQCELAENDVDDAISAYFKKRCSNSARSYFKKYLDTDSDSSVGVIDVDNLALFEEEDKENKSLKSARNSFPVLDEFKTDKPINSSKKYSDVSSELLNSEPNIDKQRILAQKALNKLNNNNNESYNEDSQLINEKPTENQPATDVSNHLIGKHVPFTKERKWFQPNFSPYTPRYFNDELSSFGTDDSNNMPRQKDVSENVPVKEKEEAEETNTNRFSQYTKKLNSILKELNELNVNTQLEFESQSKEEQINRLEEDEKIFRLENSALLHNSEISQFSNAAAEEISPRSSINDKSKSEGMKLSIGEFFNKRSNRVSSLVGSVGENESNFMSSPSVKDEKLDSFHDQSLPASVGSKSKKLMPRRCASTYDLKQTRDLSKMARYSNDSSTSNSTVMIQNILAEMESGLSGTQIYEKLMKSYGLKKISDQEKEPQSLVTSKSMMCGETPKSSKIPKKKSTTKKKKENEVDFKKDIIGAKDPVDSRKPTASPETKTAKTGSSKRPELGSIENISVLRHETIRKLKGRKGFDASTPKINHVKSQNGNLKFTTNTFNMDEDGWEVPRVSSIQPTIDFNKTEISEENEKTLIRQNSSVSEPNRKNNTVTIGDTLTIEDTIIAGDLTVLSQRIEEMKGDNVCIVRSAEPREPILLTVVQKVADLPKGTIDCSALTPLLRDQFPELLSTFPTPSKDQSFRGSLLSSAFEKTQDLLVSEPGSWVKLPAKMGFSEKIYAFGEVQKKIFVPVSNSSKNWLVMSIESVTLSHSNGNKLKGTQKNERWDVFDFVSVVMKNILIPPDSQQSVQLFFKPMVPTKIDMKITFSFKQLLGKDTQLRSVYLRTHNVNPLNSINVIPKDSINFGVIGDQCFDHRTIQVTFDGICELPLTVFIEEDESQSQHFFIRPLTGSNGNYSDGESKDLKFHHCFHEGEKQALEFRVFFQPNALLNGADTSQEFRALLVLKIGTDTESDGILQKIDIKGSVAFVKFLWNPSCSPLVFRVNEKGQSMTRLFPLKNVGSLPIAFAVRILEDDTEPEEKENMFVAPKTFYLSRNEESAFNITFNANTNENCTKRIMVLQIQPNGRAKYDVELIGLISPTESRPLSRTSNASASTKSVTNSESVPIKLQTTTHALSWPAVPLEKEARLSFQLKNVSTFAATTRISFKNSSTAFKMVNENGEKVQKLRKILKPDHAYSFTVAFQPDLLGSHHNVIIIETNHLSGKKMISLNGIGGMPNLFMGNVKSDLNGCKMITLQNSSSSNQYFFNTLEFKNGGRIPGFILIKPSIEVLSLTHELTVSPACCVLAPDSKVVVRLAQKLKNDDLRQLLSGKDISKISTLSVIMGDETSRLRLRKLKAKGKLADSERSKILTATFEGEREMDIKSFDDSPAFENQFLKSLRVVEVAVVVERSSGICEPTILFDDDDTVDEFVTICSAADTTIASTINLQDLESKSGKSKNKSGAFNNTIFSTDSVSSHNKITKWLESLEYAPPKP